MKFQDLTQEMKRAQENPQVSVSLTTSSGINGFLIGPDLAKSLGIRYLKKGVLLPNWMPTCWFTFQKEGNFVGMVWMV